MHSLVWIIGFVLASCAAAYFTALARVIFGFAAGTDGPYMGFWEDITAFPIWFALLEYPITAAVLLAAALLSNVLERACGLGRWSWLFVCAGLYTLIGVSIVAARSGVPWIPVPMSLFGPYSAGWSETDQPLLKLVITLAFMVGGIVSATTYAFFAKPPRQPTSAQAG